MGVYSDNIFVDWRIIELTAAVPADVAVIPRDYVVGIAVWASIHYAALHW